MDRSSRPSLERLGAWPRIHLEVSCEAPAATQFRCLHPHNEVDELIIPSHDMLTTNSQADVHPQLNLTRLKDFSGKPSSD